MEPHLLFFLVQDGRILLLNAHGDAFLCLSQLVADVGNLLPCYGILILKSLFQHVDFVLFRSELALAQFFNMLDFNPAHLFDLFGIVECPVSLRLDHLDILLQLLHDLEQSLHLLEVFLRLYCVCKLFVSQQRPLEQMADRALVRLMLQLVEVVVRTFL